MTTDLVSHDIEINKLRNQLNSFDIPEEVCQRIDRGFIEWFYSTKMIMPTLELKNNKPEFFWKLPNGYISVIFDTDTTNWSWKAEATIDDYDSIQYKAYYEYSGKESWSFKVPEKSETVYGYCLPSDVEKLYQLPDNFSKNYTPLLNQKNGRVPKILWSVAYWDGPISGYCEFNSQLCYFDLVEETEFERHRMYAVYELSYREQINAWFEHLKWNLTLQTPFRRLIYFLRWKTTNVVYHWYSNLFHKRKTERYLKDKEAFRASHKLIGYFKG